LRGDEGIVVITAGKIHGSELDEKVISCVRDELATTQPAPRVIGPDPSVRLAFGELRDGKGLGADAALQEYVASLKLHYAVFVTPERGETPRRWETMGGGGVAIATDHEEWYALSGLVMDLSSGLPIGSVRAQTEAKSGTIFVVPLLIVWMSQWTRDGKVCVEFGREVARLLRDEKSASPQDESRRSRMPTPDPGAVPRPADLPPETPP